MSVISCLPLQLPSMPLISASHFTPGPSSFLELKESFLLESPWLLSLPFHLRESTTFWPPPPSFSKCGTPPGGSDLKTGSRGPMPCVGLKLRQAVGVG